MNGKRSLTTAALFTRGLLVLGAAALLWALSDVVLLVFAAILLAVLLRGMAQLLAKLTRLPVNAALAIVLILALLAFGGFAWFFGPRFANEGQQLIKEVYNYTGRLEARYGHEFWVKMLQHATSGQGGMGLAPLAPKLLTVTFGTIGGFVLLIVTALYLAVSPDLYLRGAVALFPPTRRRRTRELLCQLGCVMRFWMLGQLIDMAVVGALAMVGLELLAIPLPLALGVLAGVLTFIPYLGAILAGIPAVIVASTVSPAAILWVILLYTGCHVVEGYLVAPLVSRRTVRLPPAVTVLSMAILGELYGFLGVLVATPLTAVIIVLVKELYVRDTLGEIPDEQI